ANLAYGKTAKISGNEGNRHAKRHLDYFAGYVNDEPSGGTYEDEMAQRAVDGFTGFEEKENQTFASSYYRSMMVLDANKMQADEPYEKNARRHPCAVLESTYPYNLNPTLFVNLRERTEINGVVLFTPGEGESEASKRLIRRSLSSNNVFDSSSDLDALVVYIEDSMRDSTGKPGPNARICGKVGRANNAVLKEKIHIPCIGSNMVGRYLYVEAQGKRNKHVPSVSAMLCEIM
ncbi:Dedicator of cytokinesis protein 7, partial [Cichlidogyrus casuarinus]